MSVDLDDVPHAGTERAEHIHIIITFVQEADNMKLDQLQLLVKIYVAPWLDKLKPQGI